MAEKAENGQTGKVIWITGLSGSGKTSLGIALQKELAGSILLDGDELREALGATGGAYDAKGRLELAKTYARLARLLALQGNTVIVATISLFHELHAWNRANLPGYVEIFLDVDEATRRSRDPKGLYAGNAPQMASAIAEYPQNPHLRLDGGESLETALGMVLGLLLPEGK